MSLINKMLQDLDARGSQSGASVLDQVRPVPVRERSMGPRSLAIGAGATVLALAIGGAVLAWRAQREPAKPVPAAVAPPPQWTQLTPMPKPVLDNAPPPAALAAPAPALATMPEPAVTAAPQAAPLVRKTPAAARAPAPPRPPQKEVRERTLLPAAPRPALALAEPGKQTNPQASAEDDYRHALISLQEGRVMEAIERLQRALDSNQRHAAARETLVRLLLENGRQEEAERQMRLSLGLDPRQPPMAMMLARLQLEKGGPAVETLLKTLPFATENTEYRAFLAGVLQRKERHKEAVLQYEEALREAPQNGVWWMGLGISLQEEKRPADARVAYGRALASSSLSPELRGFVERKLQTLNR